jgi:hypothetical protein
VEEVIRVMGKSDPPAIFTALHAVRLLSMKLERGLVVSEGEAERRETIQLV